MSQISEITRPVTAQGPQPDDLRYLDPQIETLPRAELDKLQELRLLAMLQYVYDGNGLIREVWDAALPQCAVLCLR